MLDLSRIYESKIDQCQTIHEDNAGCIVRKLTRHSNSWLHVIACRILGDISQIGRRCLRQIIVHMCRRAPTRHESIYTRMLKPLGVCHSTAEVPVIYDVTRRTCRVATRWIRYCGPEQSTVISTSDGLYVTVGWRSAPIL